LVSNISAIQSELERILESPWLRESAALKGLLRYVVEETLAGRQAGLKEYALGLAVFHRPGDYDPRNDAIVRVQASQLRKKLAAYYEHEGQGATLRIELPRGGYVPQFVPQEPGKAELEASAGEAAAVQPDALVPRPKLSEVVFERKRFAWGAFALGVLVALAVAVPAGWVRHGPKLESGTVLWGGFLEPKRPVVVSLGVPLFFNGGGGLFVRDVQKNQGAEPSDAIRKIEAALGTRLTVHEDVYTGVGEAMGVARVSNWLDRLGLEVTVANSHFLGESDLKGKNLVVISSMRFQTLLNARKLPVAFQFEPEGSGVLINLKPIGGEQTRYVPRGGSGVDKAHGLLTVYPGESPGTHIVYASGIHSWTTNGVAQYAIQGDHLLELDRRLAADPDDGPRGKKGPYFQVLVEVEGQHDQVRHVQYVTHRYLKMD
jgi:hypothetical protein